MRVTPVVGDFVEVARTYCTWAEGPPASPEQEARVALGLLVRLYGLALELPELSGDQEAKCIDHSEWQKMFRRFDVLPFNYYNRVFNPLPVSSEAPGVGDLADDLADIWRDLRPGLKLLDEGHVDAAVWAWRNSFSMHWGRHATGAIQALHGWLASVSEHGFRPTLQGDSHAAP